MEVISPAGGGAGLANQAAIILTSASPSYSAVAADINRSDVVHSNTPYGLFTMLAANTSGTTPGSSNYLINVPEGSYAVRVRNGGVLGTDACLEGVLRPGTTAQITCLDNTGQTINGLTPSNAAGTWSKFGSGLRSPNDPTFMKMPVPCAPGVTPVRQDLGSTSVFGTNTTKSPQVVLCSGVLGCVVYADSSNNIVGLPFQLSADGLTNQVYGTKTALIANGGNTLQYAHVVKIDATHFLLSCWDSTNTKNDFLIVTIVPGTLPTGPTVTLGTLTDDSSALSTAGTRALTPALFGSTFVPDSGGPNMWLVAATGTTNSHHARAYYLTLSTGAGTVTVSATFDFTSGQNSIGYQPASIGAGKLLAWGCTAAGNGQGFSVLTYSGGAITLTATIYADFTGMIVFGSAGQVNRIDIIDLSQGLFLVTGQDGASVGVLAAALVTLDLTNFLVKSIRSIPNGVMDQYHPEYAFKIALFPGLTASLGDGEFIATSLNPTIAAIWNYLDFKTYFQPGLALATVGSETGVQSAVSEEAIVARSYAMEILTTGATSTTLALAIAVDVATRRLALTVVDIIISTGNWGIRTYFYEFPKR